MSTEIQRRLVATPPPRPPPERPAVAPLCALGPKTRARRRPRRRHRRPLCRFRRRRRGRSGRCHGRAVLRIGTCVEVPLPPPVAIVGSPRRGLTDRDRFGRCCHRGRRRVDRRWRRRPRRRGDGRDGGRWLLRGGHEDKEGRWSCREAAGATALVVAAAAVPTRASSTSGGGDGDGVGAAIAGVGGGDTSNATTASRSTALAPGGSNPGGFASRKDGAMTAVGCRGGLLEQKEY